MTLNRATGLFVANQCPQDTYGAKELTYGLMFTPCKPCSKGLLTLGTGPWISHDDCVNPPGYGWDGFTASVCPAGFYSASGSMLRCAACPLYRNTTSTTPPFNDPPASLPVPAGTGIDQDDITDCKVVPGYGVVGNTAALSSLTPQQKVDLDVQECEQGTYSVGGVIDSVCIPCSAGAVGTLGAYSTTRGTGSIGPSDCEGELPSWMQHGSSVTAWMSLVTVSIVIISQTQRLTDIALNILHFCLEVLWACEP